MTTWERTVHYKGNGIKPRKRVKVRGKEAFGDLPPYDKDETNIWKRWFPIDPLSIFVGGLLFNLNSIMFLAWLAGMEEPIICFTLPF